MAEQAKKRLLIDSLPIQLQVVESSENGKMIVRGTYAEGNKSTANKRYYRTNLWEREVGRMAEALSERKVFGELDHPQDGRTQLKRCSHLVTGLRMEDGVVIGESEILDTAAGKDLQALLKSGAKVGVSSRGYGSTQTNDKGEEVVQDDYRLVTFDFVADPANHSSYPDVYFEEKEPEMTKQETQKSDPAKLKDEFALVAHNIFAEERDKIRAEERAKLLSDPEVGASNSVVEQIKDIIKDRILPEDVNQVVEAKEKEVTGYKAQLAEADLKIKVLEEQVQQLSDVAREVGYKYYLEQSLAGDPNADSIRTMVGDVKLYESHEDLAGAIQACVEEVDQQAQRLIAEEKRHEREQKVYEQDRQKLEAHNSKLQEALEKSTRATNLLTLEVYAERQLANHPRAVDIRQVLESSEPNTKADVDKIIGTFVERVTDREDRDAVRARIRAITSGGTSPSPLEEETGASEGSPVGTDSNYNNLGVPLGELKKLAGC